MSDSNKISEQSAGRDHAQVCIAPLAPEDAEAVSALAAKIWWRHYSGIISAAQIEYMLKQRYDPRVVRAELQRDDVWWDKLLVGAKIAGFASCLLPAKREEMKLDKLYVHRHHRRQGYGGMLIARACERGRVQGCSRLTLAVNKRNWIAISAYRKHGFRVSAAVVKDIGSGFVMDDYIMQKALED